MRAGSTRCFRWATGCCRGPTSVSCAHGGTVPSLRPPARAPAPTSSHCRVECAAALPPTSVAPPSLSVPGPASPGAGAGGPSLLFGRGREHEQEAELLAAGGCAALCAVWSSGGSARPPTTSGCGRRNWLAAKTRWRTTTAVAERVTRTLPTCEKPRARQRRAIVSPTEPTSGHWYSTTVPSNAGHWSPRGESVAGRGPSDHQRRGVSGTAMAGGGGAAAAEAVLLRAAGGIGAVRLGRRAAAARPRL